MINLDRTDLCRDRYLELLKKSLTGTLFRREPDREALSKGVPKAFTDFQDHYIKGSAVTLLGSTELENIQACVDEIVGKGVPGDLIETGVWRGGATIFMRGLLKAYSVNDRCVWVADSFEGLPEPDAHNFRKDAVFYKFCKENWGNLAATLDEVRNNFAAYDLLDERVRFLKGWFKDTLPSAPIEALSLMRLDGDYYESTMDALTNLYDKLSIGGFVIIDDYNDGLNCREAVDHFRVQRGIQDKMASVGFLGCHWWRKTSST